MSTLIAQRADVPRHLTFGVLQLALASGLVWLTLRAEPTPESSVHAVRWALVAALGGPLLVFGLRNLQRLLLRAWIQADEEGLTARVPARAGWLLPWLRVREWTARWQDVSGLSFTEGRKSRLTLEATSGSLTLVGGEFSSSLYDLDAALRQAAPERVRTHLPAPAAVRQYPGSSRLGLGIAGLLLCVGTMALAVATSSATREPSPILYLPCALGMCLLAMAGAGRRHAAVDERGLFFVHGRHTAFVSAQALRATGTWTFEPQAPGFYLLKVQADGPRGKLQLRMNRSLGMGLPLAELQHDLGTRALKGFATPGVPARRT